MWIPNNWGHSDPDVNLLSINEGEKKAVDDEGRDASCPLAVHPFLSLASTTADPVTPSRDSILVIPPICFSGREELPSIDDDHVSLATTVDTSEEQDLSLVVDNGEDDHVSIATSTSEIDMELHVSLAASQVEEEGEEEDWVWEGLSQWSLDPAPQGPE